MDRTGSRGAFPDREVIGRLVRICATIVLVTALGNPADAQSLLPVKDTNPIVTRVRLSGSLAFPKATHQQFIRTRPNRNFLGIPGMPLWLWLHSLGEAGCCFSSRLEEAFLDSGEPPAFLDHALIQSDAERLLFFYRQEGYRESRVQTRVDTLVGRREAVVTYEIDPGPATFVREFRYEGVSGLTAEQQRSLTRATHFAGYTPDADTVTISRAVNQRYSESSLLHERRRVLSFLRNEGYARVTRDSIRAFVTPVARDSFDVRMRIKPGPRYRFGDVLFTVRGPESRPTRTDTLRRPEHEHGTGYVVSSISNERKLDPQSLRSAMRFEPGEWFNQSKLLRTKRRLEAMGVFSFSDFIPQWSELTTGGEAVSTTATTGLADGALILPYHIELRTRQRHQIRVESFMLQRTAVLGDETSGGEIGLGVGSAYRNANLFGQGEQFQIRASGSISADLQGFDPFRTAQAEIETSITYPYLIWPFRRLDRAFDLLDARSILSTRLLSARRESLNLIIRGKGSFQTGIEMRHTETLSSIVRFVDFELSDPDTLAGFSSRFLDTIEDPIEKERVLEDFSRPQVNNALRYTLRSSNVNLFRRDQGYIREGSVELGGNLPYLMDRFVFTPDTLEGSLPGLPFFRRPDDAQSRLLYRQYVRFLLDMRRYRPFGERSVFAWKAIGGLAHPIGKAPVVPFDRRFYAGGASSIRGWGLRQLGPGLIAARDSVIQGGDIKLELSAEMRNTLLRGFMEADWIGVVFVDVGNVWYGPRNPGDRAGRFRASSLIKDVGLGGGVGLRVAWEFLIIRFDLGFQVRDPNDGFFADGFGSPRLHFGIGHAF